MADAVPGDLQHIEADGYIGAAVPQQIDLGGVQHAALLVPSYGCQPLSGG